MDFELHILRPQHYDDQNNRSVSAPTYLEEIPFEDEWSEEHAVPFHNKCAKILADDMACFLVAW